LWLNLEEVDKRQSEWLDIDIQEMKKNQNNQNIPADQWSADEDE
jgi:hypothetical protein